MTERMKNIWINHLEMLKRRLKVLATPVPFRLSATIELKLKYKIYNIERLLNASN